MIEFKKTNRGFVIGEFVDFNKETCSIQDSSLATEPALWLGVNGNRMHLDVPLAQGLKNALERFIDSGTIAEK